MSGEGAEPPALDLARILDVLDRHQVDYLLVGGVSANAYGALRRTADFDCLPALDRDNLRRVAAALRELGARLRVEGLSDEESRALPVQVDGTTLASMEVSTWRTDAGDFDVLTNIPGRDGTRRRYGDLLARSTTKVLGELTIRVANIDDVIASKEWANRPKDHEALEELRRLRAAGTASPEESPDARGGPRHDQAPARQDPTHMLRRRSRPNRDFGR